MEGQEQHLEVARLQQLISHQLELPLSQLIFNYTQEDEGVKLDLITINPKHDESFLFHSSVGADKITVLNTMVDYAAKTYRRKQSYTVQWSQRGSGDLHTSYFRARDMFEVLEKFFHGRNQHEYVVFSLTMNPVA